MADLEIIADGDELYVDSRLIADRLGIEHKSFLETLDNYRTQIEQGFGILRFQTAKLSGPGRPPRFAYLNEDQATFVMTLSRNSPEVIQCKLDLVSSFSKAKKLLREKQEQTVRQVPYWYQRLRLAMSDADKPLQGGYFCIYEEMLRFFATLEGRLGYIVPDYDPATGKYLIPDISIGLKFNEFLRDEDEVPSLLRCEFLGSAQPVDFREPRMRKDGWFAGGSHYSEILKYNHVYPPVSHGTNNVKPVNSYPIRYLSIFQHFLQEYWIPDNCLPYLKKRDPDGVRYLSASLSQLSPSAKQSLAGTLLGKLMQALPPSR
jgi:phage regulator Rha-like protein